MYPINMDNVLAMGFKRIVNLLLSKKYVNVLFYMSTLNTRTNKNSTDIWVVYPPVVNKRNPYLRLSGIYAYRRVSLMRHKLFNCYRLYICLNCTILK